MQAQEEVRELKVYPAETVLTGPHASQRLIVLAADGGAVVGDVTARATWTSSEKSSRRERARAQRRASVGFTACRKLGGVTLW